MCAMICPYGVIQALPSVRIASKCDRCKDLDVPACVQACPVKALVFATPDEFSQKLRSEAAAKIAREAKQLAKA
jgi:carbon-monoxide dehydrogenase iron sulfur subunit